MTDEQVRDEALTIFLAGYETVANALTWTWYLLSQNPGAADRMVDEVDEVLSGREATLEDYARLKYTENVFAESMRLFPPAWAMGRQCTKPVEFGPYRIPAAVARVFQPVHHAAVSGVLGCAGGVPPGAVHGRSEGGAAAVRVPSLSAAGGGSALAKGLRGWRGCWRWRRFRSAGGSGLCRNTRWWQRPRLR